MTPLERRDKLLALAQSQGVNSVEELVEHIAEQGPCPGICIMPACNFISMVEAADDRGWCQRCETNTVQSVRLLAR